MSAFDAAAILIVLAAALGYFNHRVVRLPHTIGLVVMGAVASLAIVGADAVFPGAGLGASVRTYLHEIDFYDALMNGMLSFLLFAGALHVDLDALMQRRWTILALATVGVLISTAIIGLAFQWLTAAAGFDIPILWCLVFGSLISPTDPVAVMSVLKSVKVPPTLEAKIAGESLFNDGVGVVLFSILVAAAIRGGGFSVAHAVELFVVEGVGGVALGLAAGWLAYWAMKAIDEQNLEVMITLALVMGGYASAQALHVSGPVAMAVAGLLIGNHGARFGMSDLTREHVTRFWELVDEILNSVLFLLIGLEVVAIAKDAGHLGVGLAAIVLVLAARAISVAIPMAVLARWREFTDGAFPVLVWGGVRGGISVALALSLPEGPVKDTILTATYVVVVFSVVVQGSTIRNAVRRFVR